MTTRVVILGGGFGGVYTALGLDREEAPDLDVTLVSRENFFLFTPMLSEIAASSIDTRHSVNPIRRLFHRVSFVQAEVEDVDVNQKQVMVRLPSNHRRNIPYDHLVIALGSVSNYFGLPGVRENSLAFKTLADAVAVRNHLIEQLEVADVVEGEDRRALLTFVVVGGGLAGVELTGDVNDFLREAAKSYRRIDPEEISVILLEAGKRLMPELSPGLGEFARRKLATRGVTIELGAEVESATSNEVTVKGRGSIATRSLIWTAGVKPTPFVQKLKIDLQKGRIPTDQMLRVPGLMNVWALGDVARIPNGKGSYHPATAQHAMREGTRLARNIVRVTSGQQAVPFEYATMGMLSTVGHRSGVAEAFGIRISGFPAWFLWRSYYLFRLPRWDKRIRVMLDWTLDFFFARDIVKLETSNSPTYDSAK
jgi:NADH:ubiquinone reductase (H+-translocating)